MRWNAAMRCAVLRSHKGPTARHGSAPSTLTTVVHHHRIVAHYGLEGCGSPLPVLASCAWLLKRDYIITTSHARVHEDVRLLKARVSCTPSTRRYGGRHACH
eukprot:scaffold127611_cov45-Tisochrysis_lutea.AAC.2